MRKQVMRFTLHAMIFASLALPACIDAAEISVGAIEIGPGARGVVPVTMTGNSAKIMALTIPLRFSTSDLRIDSVSFAGTLMKAGMSHPVVIDNVNRKITISCYPSSGIPLITEAGGLLASIHITALAGAAEQTVTIDSICHLEHSAPPVLWTRLELADSMGINVAQPSFTAGHVMIKTSLDVDDEASIPAVFALDQNYPNPFNPSTKIVFSLPRQSQVTLRIFNILGQAVETLVDDVLPPGQHEVVWQADHCASGVYFYRLTSDNEVLTRKMALLK